MLPVFISVKPNLEGERHLRYVVDDKELKTSDFISLANKIWPGDYNIEKTKIALERTINITAYDENKLIGCIRLLTDGYYFGTVTELFVLPEYQKRGIGSRLLSLAKENTPTLLYFGAQPGLEEFYEKNGCKKSLQSYIIENK